jgi:aldehyde:ferredoxin oxidoreductase
MLYGYAGKVLRVDLSKSKLKNDVLGEDIARNYIGGSGLAAWILYSEVSAKTDPLSPENKIIFATGPLVGTIAPCSSHMVVCSKSPLTGIWGESHSGGHFPAELKFAGYDAIVIEGRSEKPVYLWINDDSVEIRGASDLWGKDIYETTDIIQEELRGIKVACIGPSGENLSRIACILNDKYRAAGRTGMGAVMGSKNLKAIAVKGSKKPEIANPETFNTVAEEVRELIKTFPGNDLRRAYGTAGSVTLCNHLGNLPTRYYKEGTYENAENISGETLTKTMLKNPYACFMCPIACGRMIEVKTGSYAGIVGGGPEYETIVSFGSLCLNDNLESTAKVNELCNRFGIDTISAGNAVAFAMECCERGWITKQELDLKWGDHRGIVDLVEKIGRREGFGNVLADGVVRAAKKIGKGAEQLAVHVKGLEFPMHDPRSQKAMGLSFATSPRGAVHKPCTAYIEVFNRGIRDLGIDPKKFDRFSIQGKAELTKIMGDLYSVYNSLVLCMFAYPPGNDFLEAHHVSDLFSAATGFHIDAKELLKAGERIWNLQRLFNVREGISRKDDTLPARMLKESQTKGSAKGQIVELEPMLDEYYKLRGWDNMGIPTKRKLEKLGIKEF